MFLTKRALLLLLALLLLVLPAPAGARGSDTPERPESIRAGTSRGEEATPLAGPPKAANQPPWGTRRRYPSGPPPGTGSEPNFALAIYSGYRALAITSGLFDDNEYDFDITDDDFLAARYGAEFDFRILPRTSLVLGIETGGRDVWGSYVDLVYDDGSEIEHVASLSLTEFSAGARVRLTTPGTRFQPYVAGGLSAALYRYSETGDFVDFETYDIFYDDFRESQVLIGFFLSGGVDFALVRNRDGGSLDLFGEFRFASASGAHDEGFEGFGDLKITRTGALVGLRFRF